METRKKKLALAIALLALFCVWTVVVKTVDIGAVGPSGSAVGLASINEKCHQLTGVDMRLYYLTDALSILPLLIVLGFAMLGFCEFVKRKSLALVDRSLLVLGGYYIAVFCAFIFFEIFPVNYRPVLIDGALEASYPSSTTLLCACVMPPAIAEIRMRMAKKHRALADALSVLCFAFAILMIVLRVLSGVHFITDIVGGILLSGGLVSGYFYALDVATGKSIFLKKLISA